MTAGMLCRSHKITMTIKRSQTESSRSHGPAIPFSRAGYTIHSSPRIGVLLALVLLFLCFVSTALNAEPFSRFDPVIRALISKPSAERTSFLHGIGQLKDRTSNDIPVIMEYTGDPGELKKCGVKVRSRCGSIMTADLHPDDLDAVAALPGLRYMRTPRRYCPMLDISAIETGAASVRSGTPPSWTGYTGSGVVVGFVDTGIDANNPDFKDALGNTRILYVWDQTTGTGGANHPAGYDYGTEWTQAQINAGQCTEKDTSGHGTAVAGIAAGNGSATGYGWPAYRYVGMAPEVEIIMVKSTLYDDTVVDGINYIRSKANALGKPFVINLSLGSHFGAHDGTDVMERAIDQISGPGAVVCTATGNNRSGDGTKCVHADWTVPSRNSTATADLNVPSTRANPFLVDIWYQGNDSIEFKVTTPNGYSVTKSTGTTTGGYYPTPDGGIWLENAPGGPDAYNGDRECIIAVENAVAGTWRVTATGKTINQGGYCDAWTQSGQNVYWATRGNNSKSCTMPGTGISAITVGGYAARRYWTNPDGTVQGSSVTLGSHYSASGEGPTRDGRVKPDLCVPSFRVATSVSVNANISPTYLVEDGVHYVNSGTSMAAPHMTGVAALMLQKDPTATADEIKSRVTSTARTDSFTGAVPNYLWGYGKLTLGSAMPLMPLYTSDIAAARAEPDGSSVKMPGQVVSAGYAQMGDRFYIENGNRASGIQVRQTSGTQPGEKDIVTVNGQLGIADGERAIVNASVTRTGIGTGIVPKPIAMPNRDIGGESIGAYGLSNTGLLIQAWGRVTYIGADYFLISDGFGGGDGYREIKVKCNGLTKPTLTAQYAVVTGISSLELDGMSTIPVIRARKQADLIYY